MLCRPRGKAAIGAYWTCSCRFCRGFGKAQKAARRQLKRRERQRWRREALTVTPR